MQSVDFPVKMCSPVADEHYELLCVWSFRTLCNYLGLFSKLQPLHWKQPERRSLFVPLSISEIESM